MFCPYNFVVAVFVVVCKRLKAGPDLFRASPFFLVEQSLWSRVVFRRGLYGC